MFKRKKNTKKVIKYISILAGTCILAFGIYNVHSRCDISEGGALGLSLLAYHWLHISPGISNLIMDALAIIAGTIALKKSFLVDSIIASIAYSLWYLLFEFFEPILPSLKDKPLVAVIVGALFVGAGTSLIVMHECAAGADDSLALIFQAKTKLSLSAFYVISDTIVLLLSLSYIPYQQIGWSLLTVLLSSVIIAFMCPKKKNAPLSEN